MDKNKPRVLSVGHAVAIAERSEDIDTLLSVVEQVTKDDRIRGEAIDYHNLAVVFTRNFDDYVSGFDIVKRGLVYYPNNVDLLANAIYYGSNAGKFLECEEYLKDLEKLPLAMWNWRAYSFSIDYFLQKTDWEKGLTDKEMLELTDKALEYARREQIALSGDSEVERGYLAEHKIRAVRERYYRLLSMGGSKDSETWKKKAEEERKKAEDVLEAAIFKGQFAATACCLKLADTLFDRKDYERTIEICNKALSSPQSQPSASIGYFMYLIAMSEDAQLYKKKLFGDEVSVQNCYRDYVGAFRCNQGRGTYQKNILNRLAVLEAKSGIPAPSISDQASTI